MVESYKKYLYNQFREVYCFTGVPIRMYLKGKEKKGKPSSSQEIQLLEEKQDREEEIEEDFLEGDLDYHFENEDELSHD